MASPVEEDASSFAERDYTMSYKMPFVLSLLDNMDPRTGSAAIDDVLDGYVAFYADRLAQGLAVDRTGCPYTTLIYLKYSGLVSPLPDKPATRGVTEGRT